MARVKRGVTSRRRHKKVLKAARGAFGGRSTLIRTAIEGVAKGLAYAYHGRKLYKRDMRALWQTRISAAVQGHQLSYSRFVHGLKRAGIDLDRKVLAELAVRDAQDFGALVQIAQQG